MNAIDIIIILILIMAVLRGYSLGLVRQAGSTIGFIVGLFLGSWLGSFIMGYESSTFDKAITGLVATLFGGLLILSIGETVGAAAKVKVSHVNFLNSFDGILGSAMGALTVLLGVWLLASILVLGPVGSVQQELKNSRILSTLDAQLPPATSVLSSLNKLIDPNGFPQVFSGLEPSPNTTNVSLPSLGSFGPIVQGAEASIVKVEGTGCGGIVEGSGFIGARGEVVTNAHVVAGVANPKVIQDGVIHNTRVVWFDPNVDLAVLRVNGLSGKTLTIDAVEQPSNTPGVVLGYPGGGSFNAQPAAVIEHFTALGRNIYDQGNTARDVYSLKAHIIPGNSGGPLIGQNGEVLGIVFATSTTYNDVGYALTGHQVAGELATAEQSNTAYSTGACSE